jgi:MFS family permease
VVAFAFLVVMALGTVPSPLYGLYRARDHFSLFMVTVAFAVYAVGVIVALLLAGHLSDLYGRRRMLFPAVCVSVVSAIVSLAWKALPGLLTAPRGVHERTRVSDGMAQTVGESSTNSFGPVKQIEAGALNVGYVEAGPPNGPAVVLLQGWPYDIHSFAEVSPIIGLGRLSRGGPVCPRLREHPVPV